MVYQNGTATYTVSNNTTAWTSWMYQSQTTSAVWTPWLNGIRQETEEERPAREERDRAERERLFEAEHRSRQAEQRALKLLKDSLTTVQLEMFERNQCIPVDSEKGNKYLIRKGRQGNIDLLDNEGRVSQRLCVAPDGWMPDYDVMLAQKIFLETYEEELLRVTNIEII